MTVRLVEKFSSSIPDWLREVLPTKASRSSYNEPQYSLARYPLDKIEFEEKPIPKTKKAIENDYINGDIPVIRFEDPDAIVVIRPTWASGNSRSTNPSLLFQKEFERVLPWDLHYSWVGWNGIKSHIKNYGIIRGGKQAEADLKNLLQDRVAIRDELKRIRHRTKYGQQILNTDKVVYHYFKELDAIYDRMAQDFDIALDKMEEMRDEKANECFEEMQSLESMYLGAISRIETASMESEDTYWHTDNHDFENSYDIDRVKDRMAELKKFLDDFEKNYL